jgi:NADH-quinone oxidoreductase subunit J
MVVLSKHPIRSVIFLVVTFFFISSLYILMNAQFLAIVNIIVYAGAIMVLFLFTLMFINMNKELEPHKSNLMKLAATVAAGCLLIVLVGATKGAETIQASTNNADIGTVANLGKALYGQYLLPFEMISILLLAAMVGAVMLGKKNVE